MFFNFGIIHYTYIHIHIYMHETLLYTHLHYMHDFCTSVLRTQFPYTYATTTTYLAHNSHMQHLLNVVIHPALIQDDESSGSQPTYTPTHMRIHVHTHANTRTFSFLPTP